MLSKEQILEQEKINTIRILLSSITPQSLDDSPIKDNKIYFQYEGKEYRCKMPTQKNISDAQLRQDKLYLKLIESEMFITKEQLIDKLKTLQNVDIRSMEEEKLKIQKELQSVYLDLATTNDLSKIEEYKIELKDIERRHIELFIKIEELLSPCLQKQKEKNYIEYLTFVCTEIKNPEWVQLWSSFEDYQNSDSKLTDEALKNMSYLLLKTNK